MESNLEPSAPLSRQTPHWGTALGAATAKPDQAEAALEELCSRYWFPVYAFVRHRGNDVHTAEDLTQGFFAFVLKRHAFDHVGHDKSRFRPFLLACLHHYLLNEHDRTRALKRGGGCQILSLDAQPAEEQYQLEPADPATPEKHFERRWANQVVRRALDQLQSEYQRRGQSPLFIGLQPSLTGDLDSVARQQLARRLRMSPGAVKVAVHRARRRFGVLLRQEVAHTVSRPEDIEAELRDLLGAIAAQG